MNSTVTVYYPSNKSLMSRPRIKDAFKAGDIVIDPFEPENLGTGQYDVTLGVHFYREVEPEKRSDRERLPEVGGSPIYNPFDEDVVRGTWVLQKAAHHQVIMEKCGWEKPLTNIGPEERIIMIRPGETILAHTNEFVGSNCKYITTMMKARSSTGRNFIAVCKCAGMGDHGYCNRWTMEITNYSRHYTEPLVVGRRIAQLIFFETNPLQDDDYVKDGKYQTTSDLEKLKADWRPEDMLPKQWKDREVRKLNGR